MKSSSGAHVFHIDNNTQKYVYNKKICTQTYVYVCL